MSGVREKSARPGAVGRSGRGLAFSGVVTVLTLACCAVLAFKVPLFTSIRGWFWPLHTKPLPLAWLVLPLAGLGGVAVWLVGRSRVKPPAAAAALVVVGYALQLGFGFMEGRGIDGLRDRIVRSGHAGFAVTAVSQESMFRVAAGYERMLATGELPFYPNSTKPPGQLLFYMLTERLSRPFAGLMPLWFSPLDRLQTFASYFFPLLCYLALVPLAWLAGMMLPERERNPALVLFLFLPGVTLVTLHLDQCLYPLLALLCVGTFVHGMVNRRAWALVLSGALFYLALYVTFSVVVLAAMLAVAALLWHRPERGPGGGWRVGRGLAAAGLFVGGFVALLVAFGLVFGYDPLARYRSAMSYHGQWKAVSWGAAETARYGLLNLVEFGLWTGVPVMALFVLDTGRAVAGFFRRRSRAGDALAAGLVAALLLLAFFGRTVGETARLWLFVTPLAALLAARELGRRRLFGERTGLLLVVALQLLTTLAIKRFQDFW